MTDHTALIAELQRRAAQEPIGIFLPDTIYTRAASALSSVQAERDDWKAAHSSAVRDGRLRLAKAEADLAALRAWNDARNAGHTVSLDELDRILSSVPAGDTNDPYASVTRAAYTDTEPGSDDD